MPMGILLESYMLYRHWCWQPCLLCRSKSLFGKPIPTRSDVSEATLMLHLEAFAGRLLHDYLTNLQRWCEQVETAGLATTSGSSQLRCLNCHPNQIAEKAPEMAGWCRLRTREERRACNVSAKDLLQRPVTDQRRTTTKRGGLCRMGTSMVTSVAWTLCQHGAAAACS